MRFKPPIWAILGVIPLTVLLVSLGVWQLERGWAKAEIAHSYATQEFAPSPQQLSPEIATPPEGRVLRVQAQGQFDAQRQLLLDHQSFERRPGYRVWTLLQGPEFDVLVDRGWVPASADRERLPEIPVGDQPRSVSGFWRSLPEPALRLPADPCGETGFPRVVSYPSAEQLECLFGGRVLPGLLLMAEDLPDGYVRQWTLPNPVPPTRHYGYAAQWFAFAATLLFFFVKLNLKPQRPQ